MNLGAFAATAAVFVATVSASAIDPRARSDSASKQFSIYCEDVALRHRVVSFAEDVKADVLRALGEGDRWKAPIVIDIERATTARADEPPARVRLVESQPGFKVAIDVRIGDDPAKVNLQRQIVRAVLLEYAYRDIGVKGGTSFSEAPWWVIEGIIQLAKKRAEGVDSEVFRRLVETNKLPPLDSFLAEKPVDLGATAMAVDQALAMCLVQLLIDQPNGRDGLSRIVRHWPQSNGDPVALLKKEFPTLTADEAKLQKWWTLTLARFAASDRYTGLTAEATDKELTALTSLELTTSKGGEKKTFAIGEFDQYLKIPSSRAALTARHSAILALSTRANPLYRPVLSDYEQALALLTRGKTRGVREKLDHAGSYRAFVLRRTTEIADYLNWFEATQMRERSDLFNSYLRTATQITEDEKKHTSPVARYLDELELEY
jgi:hypothetical protein